MYSIFRTETALHLNLNPNSDEILPQLARPLTIAEYLHFIGPEPWHIPPIPISENIIPNGYHVPLEANQPVES
jgi:hypothetical protein